MKQSSFSRLSALSGVLAAIMVVIVLAVAGYFEPGYSHRVDLISELNAAGAQHATLIGYVGFIPIGLATLFFLWRLKAELAPSRKMVIALILVATIGVDWLVTALAPCDAGCPVSGNISLSQQIHLLWGFIATILMPIGIYLLIGSLRQAKFSQVAIVLSFVVIIVNVMIFILMASSMFNDALGLLQRINTGVFYVYLALLSMESYRRAVGNPV